MENISIKDILSVSLILFSVIDILGTIPIIVSMRNRDGRIYSGKATLIAAVIMVLFLFLGDYIIRLFGLDVASFAMAGAIVIFIMALEMILGITLIKHEAGSGSVSAAVPLAFPLIAGAGTLTTILSLRAVYHEINILIGILLNLLLVYLVLQMSFWLERMLGRSGIIVIRRVFGIILMAIAVKIFKANITLP